MMGLAQLSVAWCGSAMSSATCRHLPWLGSLSVARHGAGSTENLDMAVLCACLCLPQGAGWAAATRWTSHPSVTQEPWCHPAALVSPSSTIEMGGHYPWLGMELQAQLQH